MSHFLGINQSRKKFIYYGFHFAELQINMKLLQFALDAFADQIIAKQLNSERNFHVIY